MVSTSFDKFRLHYFGRKQMCSYENNNLSVKYVDCSGFNREGFLLRAKSRFAFNLNACYACL